MNHLTTKTKIIIYVLSMAIVSIGFFLFDFFVWKNPFFEAAIHWVLIFIFGTLLCVSVIISTSSIEKKRTKKRFEKTIVDDEFVQFDLYDLSIQEKEALIHFLEGNFSNHQVCFRACGIWNNLNEIKTKLFSNNMKVFEGNRHKLLGKNSPEIQMKVNNSNEIKKILSYYVTTFGERRTLYFFNQETTGNEFLEKHVYEDNNLFEQIKQKLDYMIENVTEYAPGFCVSIIVRKELQNSILSCINISNLN